MRTASSRRTSVACSGFEAFAYPRDREQLLGVDGDDQISGGAGEDVLSGGDGNDRIDARDQAPDAVDCGGQLGDWAAVDRDAEASITRCAQLGS